MLSLYAVVMTLWPTMATFQWWRRLTRSLELLTHLCFWYIAHTNCVLNLQLPLLNLSPVLHTDPPTGRVGKIRKLLGFKAPLNIPKFR